MFIVHVSYELSVVSYQLIENIGWLIDNVNQLIENMDWLIDNVDRLIENLC